MTKPVPSLLKKAPVIDKEVAELLEQALVYLNAYKDTGDWGYLPTVQHCVDKISTIHMRNTKHGTGSSSK